MDWKILDPSVYLSKKGSVVVRTVGNFRGARASPRQTDLESRALPFGRRLKVLAIWMLEPFSEWAVLVPADRLDDHETAWMSSLQSELAVRDQESEKYYWNRLEIDVAFRKATRPQQKSKLP